MTASTVTRSNASSARRNSAVQERQNRVEVILVKPAQRLWKTDEVKAFEAGVQWFLAVSRAA